MYQRLACSTTSCSYHAPESISQIRAYFFNAQRFVFHPCFQHRINIWISNKKVIGFTSHLHAILFLVLHLFKLNNISHFLLFCFWVVQIITITTMVMEITSKHTRSSVTLNFPTFNNFDCACITKCFNLHDEFRIFHQNVHNLFSMHHPC